MDTTREVLTKDYALGIQYAGPFPHENCVTCITGKNLQHSYSHNGHLALKLGELLHMDLCGPFPILCLPRLLWYRSFPTSFLRRSGHHCPHGRTLDLCKGQLDTVK
jgi:hypothetical protein